MRRVLSRLRVSLVEIFALLLAAGILLAGIRVGGWFATAAQGLALVSFVGMAVAAIAGQGRLRRFATGFVVAGGLYGGIVLYFGEDELGGNGKLPTTQVLELLRDSITTYVYVDKNTGETMTNDEAVAALEAAPAYARPALVLQVTPEREPMMILSHVLVGLLLGWLGGKFAVALGPEDAPSAREPSVASE